jgi:hypothetical protein
MLKSSLSDDPLLILTVSIDEKHYGPEKKLNRENDLDAKRWKVEKFG